MNERLEVGERVRLLLEGWGRLGETLASYDGRQVFVFGGIPGEEVMAEVLRSRRNYVAARVVEVLNSSCQRIEAPCPYFGPCTGCQWQHIDYQHQLRLKHDLVIDVLCRIGGFFEPPVAPITPSPHQYHYRNHARLTVGHNGELCYVNRETRQLVVIRQCMLMNPRINGVLEQLQGRCGETSQVSIRYSDITGDFLIQPTFGSGDFPLPSGQKFYRDSLAGRSFQISSPSFFQVNTAQTESMVEVVKEALRLTGGELLVDAYAGVGTFAILLASHVRRIIAIEESTSAIHDALVNTEGIDNIEFLQGKTEQVLAQIDEKPDGVILDPSRTGCQPQALEALAKLEPGRVVYVSCDPGTLARDLRILCEGPFSLERIQPIDMFPQTHHVECVATLTYRGNGTSDVVDSREYSLMPSIAFEAKRVDKLSLVLASASPRRRALLPLLGLSFSVIEPHIDEDPHPGETAEELVVRLALKKASWVAKDLDKSFVLGADSVVVLDGDVLGKPNDPTEARQMLTRLRGREHRVVTGVAVIDSATGQSVTATRTTMVFMREYSDQELKDYVASGEPLDKAGAYAVQDMVLRPAARVEGCYTNVMGLPLCTLLDMFKEMGLVQNAGISTGDPLNCSLCVQAKKEGPWTS